MADKGIPFDVPTRENLLQGQRLIDEQLREKSARDAKLSPLDKAYAALEAARTFGSGILATVGSLPTRAIKGEDAAQEYINQRMYIPTTEKGMDYVGNVGDFLEQLETKYKLPPVLPEAVALQNVMGPAAKQATKQAAKAAKPVVGKALEDYMFKQGLALPVVNPASNKPGIIVSNLIDEEPDIAKRLGAQARANRQAALEAEGRRKELAAQTQPSVGYRKTTEKNPDPLVGTRFVNEQATGLNPNEPFDISKFQGANALVLPWDSQSRNVKTTQVSGVDLPNQIFRKTHGGVPYSFDTGHVKKGIAGASGSEIAKRVKTRSDVATQESLGRGGTGEVLHFPITMGFRGEDYALPYSEFVFDMINNKLITGELTQKQADELSDMVRNFTPPIAKYKGQKPFAEFKGFTNPEGLNQIYTGEGMNVPSGELRKAIADRLIWQKGSQEKLGFNAEDLMNATTYEPLRGVGKGVIGASVIRNTPTGMKLTPSPWKFPYDTDFSGEHLGRLNDLVDVEALFYRTMNPIKQELMQRENKIPYTKESLRNAAIGAIEKRNEAVSQPIDQQFLDDYANYVNELKKPNEYRSGGLVSDNPDVMMMEVEDQKFVGGGIAKAIKTAAKSAVATRELEKQAVLRAEAATKSAAKQALMPQYNEAVKGMTQKQKPLSFEQWKAINYPEGTQGLQNAPQKQTFKYLQESLPAAERDANLAKMLKSSAVKQKMFHGTTADIGSFKPGTAQAVFLAHTPDEAHHFSHIKAREDGGAKNIMPVYAQVENPFDYQNLEHMKALREYEKANRYTDRSISGSVGSVGVGNWEEIERRVVQDAIKKLGHDAFYVKEGNSKNLGVYDPAKIKSAIGNRGTYDINEADINKAAGGAVYNTDPDMSDGGRIIEGAPFKRGGNVSLDAMYMAVNDAKFRRK